MGQKVHLIGFRLGINPTWDSRGYAKENYAYYLHEDFKGNNDDTSAPALAWNIEADQFLFDRFVQVFHSQLGMWNLEDTSRMNLRASTGLRFPIRWGFLASLRFDIRHETQPATGRVNTDKTYRISLGYEW